MKNWNWKHFSAKLFFAGCILTLASCGGGTREQIDTPVATPEAVGQPGILPASELENYLQAIQLIDRQEYKPAEKLLVKLSKKHDSVTGVWANLAIAYYHQNEFEKAATAAKRANELNNGDAEIQNLMGLLAVRRGEFQNAEAHYKKALELKKDFANAHYNLALLLDIYYQDIPAAYEHYNHYLSLTGGQDNETASWVEQLKYSLER